ncbi:MAG: hypothetical protein PF508_03055 [Spirochaeta sp.]|jgi:hypothetical protein|nr:hypothetical protein [Spirochaeta sp.]
MKRLIATVLIISLLAPAALFAQPLPAPAGESGQFGFTGGVRRDALVPFAEDTRSSADSYNQGVMAAEDSHSAVGWGFGGFFAGGLFSWLGTGVTVLIANGSSPTPRYIPDDVNEMSYRNGYRDEAQRKNRRAAAIPGVIMSTLWTILVISAASQ